MRNIDKVDFSPKIRVKPEFSFNVLSAARKIRKFKKEGKDFSNYKDFEKLGVKFQDYVEALANYDKITEYFVQDDIRNRFLNSLDPVFVSVYKIPNIYRIILKINNSDNKEQLFYDELMLSFFRNYIELILSNEKIDIKLKEYDIKDSDKKIYFKRPYEFVEILKSPLLSKQEKEKMINDTYNTCKTIKYSSLMIENLVSKENLINIDLEDQRYLLNKWLEIRSPGRHIKKLSKLGVK